MREPTLVATAPVSPAIREAHATLRERHPNFRPVDYAWAAAHPGWHVDRRRTTLAAEPPGPPVPDGPFEVARRAMADYEFADPALVRAVYSRAAPLEGRDMLLEGRFLWLRFPMPVRVGGVVDCREARDGRPVHRFGWYYQTLEGHLERGQMNYDLLKWADTGELEVRIRAYSTPGDIDNPIVRLGFAVFGRWVQLRFHDRAASRLRALVEQRTGTGTARVPVEGDVSSTGRLGAR